MEVDVIGRRGTTTLVDVEEVARRVIPARDEFVGVGEVQGPTSSGQGGGTTRRSTLLVYSRMSRTRRCWISNDMVCRIVPATVVGGSTSAQGYPHGST